MAQIRPPVAPNLPQAPGTYDGSFHERHSNALRLYFNQAGNAFQQLLYGFNNYATLINTGTITAAVANTAYPVAYTSIGESYGITLAGTPASRITVAVAGVYNFQFAVQMDNLGGGTHHAHLWFRVNGVDVPYSASKVVIVGPNAETVASWNYLLTLQAGDYFELMWAASNTDVVFLAEPAAAPVPAVPSVFATMYYLFPNSAI